MVELRAISDAWRKLMMDKTVRARTVYHQIKPENLAPERLEDPEVKKQLEEKGHYEVAHELPEEIIEALESLTEIGYVEKKVDRIYNVGWYYIAHPYVPHISVSGAVGIISDSKSHSESMTLNSSQYDVFDKTARKFKMQVDEGKHPHITRFAFNVDFSYETDVYELKTKYFDAIALSYNQSKKELKAHVTEPIVERRNDRESKNWEMIETIDAELFLSDPDAINAKVEELEWKKEVDGILVFQGRAYTLIPPDKKINMETEDEENPWAMPNFLDGGIMATSNYLSRIFEDATAEFLRDTYHYDIKTRHKPEYLGNKEVDVFAEKGVSPRQITICECKLRFNEAPISMSEVNKLSVKARAIEDNERTRGETKFYKWLVTNSKTFEAGVLEYAKNLGIKIITADIGERWRKRSDWKINKIIKQN